MPTPPVTFTDGVYVLPFVICTVKLAGLLCTAHDGLPFVPLPLKLNVLPLTASRHWAVGADPALAVGLGFTVTVTSLVAVPHEGVWLLGTLRRNVTVPVPPVTFTDGVYVVPFVICTVKLFGLL